jgi:hypothetical protein
VGAEEHLHEAGLFGLQVRPVAAAVADPEGFDPGAAQFEVEGDGFGAGVAKLQRGLGRAGVDWLQAEVVAARFEDELRRLRFFEMPAEKFQPAEAVSLRGPRLKPALSRVCS